MQPRYIQSRSAATGGFTLVELVVVITILGILAAMAVPRFASIQSEARAAKANAFLGSIRAAASMVKATAIARGASCAEPVADGTTNAALRPVLEGTAIDMNFCYPQALASATTGILAAANINPANDGIAISGTGGATGGSVITITVNGATAPANCSVAYTSPNAAQAPPTITLTTSGC